MSITLNVDDFSDSDEFETMYPIRNMRDHKTRNDRDSKLGSKDKIGKPDQLFEKLIDDGLSYRPSRHERLWINQSLGDFYQQHWFDDIIRLIKGGKEANVYHCLANSSVVGLQNPYIAAKVYRPRRFRNLKNDHMYREGRDHLDGDGNLITDDGMLHAINKRTEYGQELLHTSWIEHEVKTLQLVKSVGVDVPHVFASGANAILMAYIGDHVEAAPILHSVELSSAAASQLFERVIDNIDRMLSVSRVHGDLSAYNILYWEGEISIIDFPQAIDPSKNRNAFRIFERDVVRICEYFNRQGVESDAKQIALGLWKKHQLKIIPDIHPGMLDADDNADLKYWIESLDYH